MLTKQIKTPYKLRNGRDVVSSMMISAPASASGGGGGTPIPGTSWLEDYFTDTTEHISLSKQIIFDSYPLSRQITNPFSGGLFYWDSVIGALNTTTYAYTDLVRKSQEESISGQWYFTTKARSRIFDIMQQTGTATTAIGIIAGKTEGGFVSAKRGVHFSSNDIATHRHLAFLNWEYTYLSGAVVIGGAQRVPQAGYVLDTGGGVYARGLVQAFGFFSSGSILAQEEITSQTYIKASSYLESVSGELRLGAVPNRVIMNTSVGNFQIWLDSNYTNYSFYFNNEQQISLVKDKGLQLFKGGLHIGQTGQPYFEQVIEGSSPTYYIVNRMVNNLNGFRWFAGTTQRMQLLSTGALSLTGAMTISSTLGVTGAGTFSNTLIVGNTLTASQSALIGVEIGSVATFSSGFSGSNWRIQRITGTPNRFHLTVDRLTVRQEMNVYELVINQVRGTNGSVLVSDTAKISTVAIVSSTVWDITVDTGGETTFLPFVNGDKVLCQKWTSSGTKFYEATVSNVNLATGVCRLTRTAGSSTAEANDVIGRIDSTVSNRRGYLYLTASDANAPYMDVVYQRLVKVRLGLLTGISDAAFGAFSANTFGLYSDNVFLKGRLILTGGGIPLDNEAISKQYSDANYASTLIVAANDATIKANAAYNNSISYSSSYTNTQISNFQTNLGDLAFEDLIDKTLLDTTIIQGGLLVNTLINTVWLQAQIVTANYIEGQTINFQQGTIGGWRIDNTLFYSGLLYMSNPEDSESIGLFFQANYNSANPEYSYPFIMLNGPDNNYIKLYYDNGISWGLIGVSLGSAVFQLGYTNRIAGWEFTSSAIQSIAKIPSTTTSFVIISSTSPQMIIRPSTSAYVRMFYFSESSWGVESNDSGYKAFQLGSTNQIAGWEFGKADGSTGDPAGFIGSRVLMGSNAQFVVMSNSTAESTVGGQPAYIRRGFGVYTYGTAPGFKLLRLGMLSNSTSTTAFPTIPVYGMQIGIYDNGYKEIFRVDSSGINIIAGINFNAQRLWATNNNWEINADGSVKFLAGKIGNFTISSGGIVNDDMTSYIICRDTSNGLDARIGSSVFPAISSFSGITYFRNEKVNAYGGINTAIYALCTNSGTQGKSFAIYAKAENDFTGNNDHYAGFFSGQVRIEYGMLRIPHSKVLADFEVSNSTLAGTDYSYLPVGVARIFVFQAYGTTYSIIRLPTNSEINTALGNTNTHCFKVTIHSKHNSTQTLRVQPNPGVTFYNNAGNPFSYIDLGSGDTVELLYNELYWQILNSY